MQDWQVLTFFLMVFFALGTAALPLDAAACTMHNHDQAQGSTREPDCVA